MKEALYMQNKVKVFKLKKKFYIQFGDGSRTVLDSDEDILYLKDKVISSPPKTVFLDKN